MRVGNHFWIQTEEGMRRVRFVTTREFAMEWQVAERTILRWIEEGLPHWSIGDETYWVTMIPRRRGNAWVVYYKA